MREDLFKSDGIWTTFAQIETTLNSFSENAKTNPEYGDLKKQLDFILWVLERSDPSLITQSELNQTRSELNQLLSYLQNDAASWQHAATIQSQISQSLSRFSQVRQKRLTRSESLNLINGVKSEIDTLNAKLRETSENTAAQAGIAKAATDVESGRIKELQEEISRIDALVATKFEVWEARIEAEYQGKLATWTSELSSAQMRSAEQLAIVLRKFSDDTDSSRVTIDSMTKALKTDRERAEDSLTSLYSKMKEDGETTLRSLVDIYEQAGQVALSGGFVEASRSEEKSYEIYAKLASAFFVFSAATLGMIWYDSVENKLSSLSDVVLRIPISVVILLPAFYFASLASKHRKTAVSLRSLGLRIKAFDAYTIKAAEKDRQKLREELAPVFFDEDRTVTGNNGSEDALIGKVVDRLGSAIETIVDKIPIGRN